MMNDERVEDGEHYLEFTFINSFDHEFLIMCQEEEASTFARALTSFKNLVSISLRAKALFKHLES